MKQISGLDPLENYPKLRAWTEAMYKTRAVKETIMPTDLHVEFLASFAMGYPAYDAGLPAKLWRDCDSGSLLTIEGWVGRQFKYMYCELVRIHRLS